MIAVFRVGDLVRRRVDGVPMVIIDTGRSGLGEWKCAWMDGHLRHADEFTAHEIEHRPPIVVTRLLDGTASLPE